MRLQGQPAVCVVSNMRPAPANTDLVGVPDPLIATLQPIKP